MTRPQLRHNPSNPVTAGIWRVPWGDGTAIRKVVTRGAPVHPDWEASEDPTHWNYWAREALVYEHDLPALWRADGLRAPALLHLEPVDDHTLALTLEDVRGRSGVDLGQGGHVLAAHRVGVAQGRLAVTGVPEIPWLTAGFLRQYVASKHVRPALLDDDRAWAHPLCAHWPADLRPLLVALWDARDALLDVVAAGPTTLAHHDLWAHNLLVTDADEVVVIDWSSVGLGALGEDPANLVAEAVLDDFFPADALPDLSAAVLDAYLEGLRAGGWRGPTDAVRRVFHAAGVKWCWMGALHLERMASGVHHDYGGAGADPAHQLQQRGLALRFLAAQAIEALQPRSLPWR